MKAPIEMLERAVGPLLFMSAVLASSLLFHTLSDSLRVARNHCFNDPVLSQGYNDTTYLDNTTAERVIGEIITHPDYVISIRIGADEVSYRFLPDGGVLMTKQNLNDNIGVSEEETLLVNSVSELDLTWIVGDYACDTVYDEYGVLATVKYFQEIQEDVT